MCYNIGFVHPGLNWFLTEPGVWMVGEEAKYFIQFMETGRGAITR